MNFNDDDRCCISCTNLINAEVRLENDPSYTKLNILRTVANQICFICHRNQNLQNLSLKCRVSAYCNIDVYIPPYARCCHNHLDNEGCILRALLPGLSFFHRSYLLVGRELSEFLSMLQQCVKSNQPDFTNENSFSDQEFQLISPITKEQFHDLLSFCDAVAERNDRLRQIKKKDLIMFLC